jgi:hypothetical protein
MAGRRPLVDRTIKGALFSWGSTKGSVDFTTSQFFDWMVKNDLIPNNCHGFNQRMVGNRIAFWAKTNRVEGLKLISKWNNSGAKNTYRMEDE